MTATWLAARALAQSDWLLPGAFALVLLVQVGGWLAAERLVKFVARRRRGGQS